MSGRFNALDKYRGVPTAIVEKLNEAVNAALSDSNINKRLLEIGAIPMPGSPSQFETFVAQETERYARVIRSAGISGKQ
jgi:tripartite-type tricarboxylate transporter receptor subunit TctC